MVECDNWLKLMNRICMELNISEVRLSSPPSPLISLNTKTGATNIHHIAFVSKIVSSLRSLLSLLTPLTIPLLLKKLKIPSQ